MASAIRPLQGGCACGRNVHVIHIPTSSSPHKQISVMLDNSSVTRRHTTAPFTPLLRIPLDWYHSGTYAFFPDETHRSIRRTFTSPSDGSQAQRSFCGYCGTQLSNWDESSLQEAGSIHVHIGTLIDEDIARLERWGLFSSGTTEEEEDELEHSHGDVSDDLGESAFEVTAGGMSGMQHRGTPWFEDMVQESRFGRIRRQRGGQTNADGNETLQWEVVEVGDNGLELPIESASGVGAGKRKREEGPTDADVHMRG